VENTGDVMDLLRKARVHATFFVVAKRLKRNPELQYQLLKRMLTEGDSIGNHGYDHEPDTVSGYLSSSVDDVKKDFIVNKQKLSDLFAKHKDKFPGFQVARLPGSGSLPRFHKFVDMIVNDLHVPHASWDFEFAPTEIAERTNKKGQKALAHLKNRKWQGIDGVSTEVPRMPKANEIILMHERHFAGRRLDLLAKVIAKLQEVCNLVPIVPVPKGLAKVRYP